MAILPFDYRNSQSVDAVIGKTQLRLVWRFSKPARQKRARA
jgi:hypothetical protein